ncbi:unnamed protein product [Euphydryas editha]|uniref:Peptidase S1 domain-containing protein n=1 Tax=Euphydryas editha TaxID=104508 RepID=A0AAU9TJB9_EUPED|nr:unnamed protein product [Euphydryas editha]
MWKCFLFFMLAALTFTYAQDESFREKRGVFTKNFEKRGVFTKNFFGGVWGNRPPLLEANQPRTTCTCKCGERNEESRIVGGREAGINEFPWMAKLSYFKRFYCGGMIINDRYVLTAAHCVKGFMWFMIKVTFGEHDRCNATQRPETRFVIRAIANKFTLTNFDNDIALLRLNERIPMSGSIKPICLPTDSSELYVGVKAVAAGWGTLTEEGKVSCKLQEVEVPVLSNQECKNTKYTSSMITNNMLCAGYPKTGQKDSCQGDSGGPLIAERKHDHRYELIGVVSWGNGCARVGYPGVYTRGLLKVSDDYYAYGQHSQIKLPTCRDCSCGERNEEARVVGGSTADLNAFPWIARLIYHNSFGCGASLINDKYVITAAHCVKGFMWFMFKVKFGEHDRCDTTSRPELRHVVKMYVHNFTLTELTNDISLLRLSRPVEYSFAIRPVCLPKDAQNLYAGSQATVSGWGATAETGKWSCTLQEAQLPVLSNEECQNTKYNKTKIKDVMMCAGYPETAHKDACTGDSGGPLIKENDDHAYDLIGVVSWGYGCARIGFPGVYTRVTKYLDWIRDNTEDACYCDY